MQILEPSRVEHHYVQRLVASLPDARLVVLEDSAHSAPEEEPETVAKTVWEFAAHLGRNQ